MQESLQGAIPERPSRLLSLDIFRGITMIAMILVNNAGIEERSYAPLLHAKWNGITPTDFIFPSFVFMVGISITLSYSRQLANGVPKRQMIGKILKRALILFALGVFLSIVPLFNFKDYRVPGVLQRIGIVFAACALLFLYKSWKFQARLGAIILVAYCLVMTLVPVPGYGYPILEPGKNLAAWLDSYVIPGRMWQGTWDPEGVLSTFPAIVTGICGMLAGHLIISKKTPEQKIIWLFLAGFISFALANGWNWFFPINKNLWTSPFVLYVAGLDGMILASMYYIVDVLGYKNRWTFALAFGSNAIAAYVIADVSGDVLMARWHGPHSLSANDRIINAVLPSGLPPEIISLVWAILFCLLCFIPVYILYKKKIFLKI